jgi:hypothetical protein
LLIAGLADTKLIWTISAINQPEEQSTGSIGAKKPGNEIVMFLRLAGSNLGNHWPVSASHVSKCESDSLEFLTFRIPGTGN